ncbi:uncharacterized protein PFL1_02240 [Pseudozyma flocculosa PF-1]|uniref:uncharacterized protein n=1 Tax=Pseudozyma flocculosa PF-1 TaxID=1277687 RepID=UPI0004560375|nr:uncharacterized protein PFL1_02240 [Pseudozyma flocculosa PF-1]EPQ30123.1 hypothetical protein PFL1_02240 [Pseudozyma flocculosa PF-1]
MSLPKVLAQILFVGTQIVGKALVEAGRQAGRNARAGRVEAAAAAGGASGTGTGSPSDALTRSHRMTLDEAKMILNLKQDVSYATLVSGAAKAGANDEAKSLLDQVRENMVKNYDHLFKTNAPPAPKGKEGGGQGSFYIQSKIVRARERIEAEWSLGEQKGAPEGEAKPDSSASAEQPEQPKQ